MTNVFYLYRFLGKNDKLLYIGRTNDINRRILNEHFTALGHLPVDCYKSTERVEYAEFINESEEVAYEAILINKLKPKYNVQFKDDANFNVKIPDFEWKPFEFRHEYHLQYLKNRKDKTQSIVDFISEEISELELNANDNIKTGFADIDSMLPLAKSDFILVAGDNMIGKTDYALTISLYASYYQQKKVLYLNLKEDSKAVSEKMLANQGLIPLKTIRSRTCTEKHYVKLARAMEELAKTQIELTNLTYEEKTIDKIIEVIKSNPSDLVIIDDLQSITNDKTVYIKDKALEAMQKLKSLTVDVQTPIVLLTAIPSDKVATRMDHRPILNDLDYDSMRTFPDVIKLLYRNEVYHVDIEKENIMEVYIAKSPVTTGVFELVYLKDFHKVCNIER